MTFVCATPLLRQKKEGLRFDFIPSDEGAGKHPNTVTIKMYGLDNQTMSVTGESLGGGRIRISSIDGISVEITGDYPTLFVAHQDVAGVLAALTGILSTYEINIATMRTFRAKRGGKAYTVFEVDNPLQGDLLTRLRNVEHVHLVNTVNIPGSVAISHEGKLQLGFETGAQLLELCDRHNMSIGEVMRNRELTLCERLQNVDEKNAPRARSYARGNNRSAAYSTPLTWWITGWSSTNGMEA